MQRRNVHKEDKSGYVATEYKHRGRKKTQNKTIRNVCKIASYAILGVIAVFFTICLLIYATVESPIDAVWVSLPSPEILTGTMAPKTGLTFAERLYENQLSGPESMVFHQGHIYTGTSDGKVLDIVDGNIRTLATFGQPPCGSYEDEPTCGRPLGLRLHPDGTLIVVDTYLGIFKVNLSTGIYHRILSRETKVGGFPLMFPNDLDIDADGVIYFSDSSTKWGRVDFLYCLFEGRSDGRLMRFDPSTNTTDVLISNLSFANGVQLSKDKGFVLVSELGMAKIHRYYLKGVKKGTADIFAENLPVLPDNIRPSRSGGFWIGSSVLRQPGSINWMETLSNYPVIKNLVTKLFDQMSLVHAVSLSAVILELDAGGQVVQCLWDPLRENLNTATEVHDDNGVLYIGSFIAPWITRFDTNKPAPTKGSF